VPQLSPPTVQVHASFLAAMAEFPAERRGDHDDHTMIGSELPEYAQSWSTPAGFGKYVRWLCAQALHDSPRPEGGPHTGADHRRP
jgi:hypothetical protein